MTSFFDSHCIYVDMLFISYRIRANRMLAFYESLIPLDWYCIEMVPILTLKVFQIGVKNGVLIKMLKIFLYIWVFFQAMMNEVG